MRKFKVTDDNYMTYIFVLAQEITFPFGQKKVKYRWVNITTNIILPHSYKHPNAALNWLDKKKFSYECIE